MTIKIVSAAQHAMLTKAADDPAYAKQRGISQGIARDALAAHAKTGTSKLPERANPKTVAPRAVATPDRPMFLISHRGS